MTDFENHVRQVLSRMDTRLYNMEVKMKRERLEKLLLDEIKDKGLQKQVVKEFVSLVQIEIHNFCNRQCWWCGNKMVDRHSCLTEMPEETFISVLENLREIDFRGTICLSKFNESFANTELLHKRAKQVKEYLPYTYCRGITNGDYIKDKQDLFDAYSAGVDDIDLSLYLKNEEYKEYSKELVEEKIKNLLTRLNLEYDSNLLVKGNDVFYSYTMYPVQNKRFYIGCLNFDKGADTMGHIIEQSPRYNNANLYYPCDMPFSIITIEHSGVVTSCCNVRGDMEQHSCFQIGNVNKKNIFNIFCSKKAAENRKRLLYYGIKEFPCRDCGFYCNGYNALIRDAIFSYN